MAELDSHNQSALFEAVNGEWMPLGDALDRFEPPANMVIAAAVEKEAGRYGFKIASLGLLIKAGVGSEVMQMPMIWSLPGAPPWLLGLINLRGNLVPVYDLRQVMGLGARSSDIKPLVLVFDQGDKAVGVLIDDFPKPLTGLTTLSNLPQLPTVLEGHIHSGYVKDETIWMEFDHNSFFEELSRSFN